MAVALATPKNRGPLLSDEQSLPARSVQLIKSRDRVRAHGEVFTPRHMVDRMLDLVKPELETGPNFVDSTFFEPAAGDGNFLVAILQRKLAAIRSRRDPDDWPLESLFALASIYGVELLEDNHADAQAFLLAEFVAFHGANNVCCDRRTNLWRAANYLIENNVVQGNTLTGLHADGRPIELSWWNRIPGGAGLVQREPFLLESLRSAAVGAFDFATYTVYRPCRIDQVHKEVEASE